MALMWKKTVDEIGLERFDEAFMLCLQNSTFRPDIAEIRRFAGLPAGVPNEQEAMDEFKKIIIAMRHHGWKLTNRGKPEKDPPVFSDVVMGAIHDMGHSDLREGYKAIWRHPALDLTRQGAELDELEKYRMTAGEKIEKRWVQFYIRRKSMIPSEV
jgi:hypothetical protein